MTKTILVTGCGGDVGSSIGRILKESFLDFKILGCDITANNLGKFIFDSTYTLPRANSPSYFPKLKKLINTKFVDLIIPISEDEIRLFYKNKFNISFESSQVIMPNISTLKYGFDKMKTSLLLSKLGLTYPWTLPVIQTPLSVPCIIKNRGLTGKGDVEIVDSHSINYFRKKRSDDIWQEYLEGDEFTCGLYGTKNSIFRSIIFKRKLSSKNSGFTISGEVIKDQEIEKLLKLLAKGLNLRGSCNVQLRLTKEGPKIFEINPRFSSTVMFRHKLGFTDVIWSCNEAFGLKLGSYNPPKPGTIFYKGYTEYLEIKK